MKKISLIFALLLLNSCSLMDRKAPAEPSLDAGFEDVAAPAKPVAAVKEAPEEKPPEPVKPLPKGSPEYAALRQAVKSGSDEKIYTAATDILTKRNNDAVALNALAMYHFKKGRLDLSKYLLSKGISQNPNMSALYSNLGVVHLALNEKREAIQALKKALQLNSDEVTASANLGAIYVQEKDFRKAAIALELAHRRGVKDAKFLNNFGILKTAQGEFPAAKKAYEQSLKLSPDSKEVMLNLSILLIEHMKNYEEGLQVLGGLKFVGGPDDSRNLINVLENKALTGLNQK